MWTRSRSRAPDVEFDSPEARALRLRERSDPRPGDPFYVHLVDLRDALAEVLASARGRWLDFGSDTSPYRSLMPGCRLESADLPRIGEKVDHVLDGRGMLVDVADSEFDGVISTQVLEHLEDHGRYLSEARRVLRPDGMLVLTTHGIWEDHPSPLDLRRWTLAGLTRDVQDAGFEVTTSWGLTCRRRASLLLVHQQFLASDRAIMLRRVSDRISDRLLRDDARRSASSALLYVGVLLVAHAQGQ